jgi:transcriptional regulator with XRE-family HTH domain
MKEKKEMIELNLILESESTSNELWGRMNYKDDLIVYTGSNIDELQEKFKTILLKKYSLKQDDYNFALFYDLTALFKEKSFLNVSVIAQRAGIDRSLMAQYAAGIKLPSLERAAQIQEVIHSLGYELLSVNLAVRMQPVYALQISELVKENLRDLLSTQKSLSATVEPLHFDFGHRSSLKGQVKSHIATAEIGNVIFNPIAAGARPAAQGNIKKAGKSEA